MTKKIKITRLEIMCYVASQELKDGQVIFAGYGFPMVAAALANKFHAPHAQIIMEGGLGVDEFLRPPIDIADLSCTLKSPFCNDFADVFTTILYRGYIDVGFLGAAQVDKHGNINSTVVGDYDDFKYKLPGSGGAYEVGGFSKETVIMLANGKFVERLDYLTTPGYLEGYESRYEAGFPPGTGPSILISTKGVFRFDRVTREIFLSSYHRGITIDEIRKDIPWDLKISPDVKESPMPSEEEINFVRNFAPHLTLGSRFIADVYTRNLTKFITAKKNADEVK
jgi:glutaconate CoA-transferase, subunit B